MKASFIKVAPNIVIHESEIQFTFTSSPGPGGQNVNKVATAVQLRFDINHSVSLPEPVRIRLATLAGKKITNQGELIIKASRFRSQALNKQDALDRLTELLKNAANPPRKRKKTRPTKSSIQRRITTKKYSSAKKSLRRKEIGNE